MSNNTRPFEIGDLVIVQISKEQKPFLATITRLTPRSITIDDEWDLHESSIKTIRKPRKGGREARDIVAKLCLMYLNHKRNTKKDYLDVYKYWDYFNKERSVWDGYHEVPDKDFFSKKEEGALAKLLALQNCYEKAKSMLE